MSDLYLIFKNMTRNKLRLIFNTLAIVIAFLLFGVLGAINYAFNMGIELSADDRLVVINKINFTQPLPYSYIQKVRAVEGVKGATHANWVGAYVKGSKHFFAGMAVDAETYLDVYGDFIEVDPQQAKLWKKNRQGVLVGKRLAEIFSWKVGDRIPIASNIFSKKDGSDVWDMVIDGTFDAPDSNFLLMHYPYFNETQSFGGDFLGWLVLITEDPSLNEQVAKEIDQQFENSFYETKTSSEKQFNKAFIEQIGSIGLIISSVVAAAFFTILMVVGNTMVSAVRERIPEIAVLKTLGFSSKRIFRMVLLESLFIALVGGGLGVLLASVMISGMAQVPNIKSMLPNLVLPPKVMLLSIIYMLALGLLTGALPAYRAMQLKIIDAFSRG